MIHKYKQQIKKLIVYIKMLCIEDLYYKQNIFKLDVNKWHLVYSTEKQYLKIENFLIK